MRGSRDGRGGRGWVRGLFLFTVLAACACDKTPPTPVAPDLGPKQTIDAGTRADAAGPADAQVDVAPPPPTPFSPPWNELAPTWDELSKTISDTVVGTMSGEAWGNDVPVHALVRSQCGGGSLLQAVFKSDKGLRVSPVMPVRFFGLPTSGKPVVYKEGGFTVTSTFTSDTPERVAGTFVVKYDEHGQEKTFIDLTVDARPLTMLYEPMLDGKDNVPQFQSCHPSGRFYARAEDGRVAQGFLYAGASADGNGIVLTPHLTDRTGLRIVLYSQRELSTPWTLDLSKANDSGPVRVVVDALYTPELTSPAEAAAQNIGSPQTVSVRTGSAEVVWTRKGKSPELSVRFTGLRIPELIEGPLRGTTFTELLIEATAVGEGVYPPSPPAEPLTPAPKE